MAQHHLSCNSLIFSTAASPSFSRASVSSVTSAPMSLSTYFPTDVMFELPPIGHQLLLNQQLHRPPTPRFPPQPPRHPPSYPHAAPPSPRGYKFPPDILPHGALTLQTPRFLRVVPLGARNDDAPVGILAQERLVKTVARLLARAHARLIEILDQIMPLSWTPPM